MKLAVISDIHGNLLALEAVLADIAHQRVDQTVNLGDILSGPLQPAETADLLMAQDFLTIRGNHERQLLALLEPGAPVMDPLCSDGFAAAQVSAAQAGWLGRCLPGGCWSPASACATAHQAPTCSAGWNRGARLWRHGQHGNPAGHA